MARGAIGFTIFPKDEFAESRTIQIIELDGSPQRVTAWSIESDWLYVHFNGHREAFRLYPEDDRIVELHDAPEKKKIAVT